MVRYSIVPPQHRSRIAAAIHHLATNIMSTTLRRRTPVPSPAAVALRANRSAAGVQLDQIELHTGIKAGHLYLFEIGQGEIDPSDYDRACVGIQEIADRVAAQAGEPSGLDHHDASPAPASAGAGLERQEDAQPQQEEEIDAADEAALPEGQRLRAMREAAGVSRIRVSRRIGVPAGTLARHEASHSPLPPGEFDRIAEAIEVLAANNRSRTPDVAGDADMNGDADDEDANAPSADGGLDAPSELPAARHNPELRARAWLWQGRISKGLSLDECAKKLAIPWKTLDALERGARFMRMDQIEEAAALLGVPLQVALGEPDPQSPLDGGGADLTEAMARWHRPAANDEAVPEVVLRSLAAPARERMIAARKALGWDQTEAARRLGYANSTQLCLLESGSRPVTLESVARAARVYRTSADFILGVVNDTDGVSSKDRITERLGELMQTAVTEMAGVVERHEKVVGGPTVAVVREMVARGQAFLDALASFTRANHDAFIDMRAGASLERAAEDFGTVMLRAKRAVVLHEVAEEQMRDAFRVALRTGGEAANDPAEKNGSAHAG